MSRSERHELFLRCKENIVDPEAFVTGWQLRSSSSDESIRRDNLRDWFLWGFFAAGEEVLSEPGVLSEVEEYVSSVEDALGRKLPPGRNPSIKGIRLTLDGVRMHHRPLVFYAIILLLDLFTAALLWSLGFTHHTTSQPIFPPRPHTLWSQSSPTEDISYWFRPSAIGSTRDGGRVPSLLFLHGISIGVLPYVSLISGYSKRHPDMPVVLPEFLSISFRLTRPPPPTDKLCQAIRIIFDHHGIHEYTIAAHSYGTGVAAAVIKHSLHTQPNLSSSKSKHTITLPIPRSLILIDPICILLHLPPVARNFLHRVPKHANEHELYYFASTDPGVAHTLGRHFFWSEYAMWKDELAQVGLQDQSRPRVAVILSGDDIITDAPTIWAHLTGLPAPEPADLIRRPFVPPVPHPDALVPVRCESVPNVLAVYLPGLDHAQLLMSAVARKGIQAVMEEVSIID